MRVALPNSAFTVGNLYAGAGDSINRLALTYDVVTSLYDIQFVLPSFKNSHAPNLDFFDVLGLKEAHEVSEINFERRPPDQINVSLVKLVKDFLNGGNPLEDGKYYRIYADTYGSDIDFVALEEKVSYSRRFKDTLQYKPLADPFMASNNFKAVFHMRRYDITGNVLFEGLDDSILTAEVLGRVQSRQLLNPQICISVLEKHFTPEGKIDLIIASDGMSNLASRFQDIPIIQDRIAELSKEFDCVEAMLPSRYNLVDKIIGRNTAETRATMDAIFHADAIITASSAFPRLIAEASNSRAKIHRWK